jgi:DNA-binding transcriptional MerR regulator
MAFKIGTLAQRVGTTAPTIRYYEEIGLLPRAERRENGQRSYGNDATERLTFIRRCREFGFSIEEVRTLINLMQDRKRSCVEARDLAIVHLALGEPLTGNTGENFESHKPVHESSAPPRARLSHEEPPLQGSLPAGWLAFTGRESNPQDRYKRAYRH